MIRDLEATFDCFQYKPTEILPIEEAQRDKLKYRKAGATLDPDDSEPADKKQKK